MKKTIFYLMALSILSSTTITAIPSLFGTTGLIGIPTAESLKYREMDISYDYVVGKTPELDDWYFRTNLGIFQNLEAGLTKGMVPNEGAFVNLKYFLMSDNSRFPLYIAIGFENLFSGSKTGVYMIATKKLRGGLDAHFGFTAQIVEANKINPSIMGGLNYYLTDSFVLLGDVKGEGESYLVNGGLRLHLNQRICISVSAVDISDVNKKGIGWSVGTTITNFL